MFAQVRALLIDPAWLEVKLHCYGVAVVVDDFRSYLQVKELCLIAVLSEVRCCNVCDRHQQHAVQVLTAEVKPC